MDWVIINVFTYLLVFQYITNFLLPLSLSEGPPKEVHAQHLTLDLLPTMWSEFLTSLDVHNPCLVIPPSDNLFTHQAVWIPSPQVSLLPCSGSNTSAWQHSREAPSWPSSSFKTLHGISGLFWNDQSSGLSGSYSLRGTALLNRQPSPDVQTRTLSPWPCPFILSQCLALTRCLLPLCQVSLLTCLSL